VNDKLRVFAAPPLHVSAVAPYAFVLSASPCPTSSLPHHVSP